MCTEAEFNSFHSFKGHNSRLRYGCSIDILHYMNLNAQEICAYTNKIMKHGGIYKSSFERIDTSKGYVPGNIIKITNYANSLRSNHSSSDISKLLYHSVAKLERLQIEMNKKGKTKEEIKHLRKIEHEYYVKIKTIKGIRKSLVNYENMSMLDKFKVYNGFNIDSEITKVIGVAINDFCIRAFCKGQGWISSTLYRARNTESSILKS